jgi:transmembrane sensor
VRVTLVEGRLSVTGPGLKSPLLIAPGERLTADGDRTPVVAAAQGERQLSWQNGFATFDNVSLSEAAAALNRYPGETLVVRDPRVAGLRISGNFRLGDPKRFGRALEQIYPVRLRERGPDQVEIVPAG